MRKTMLVALVCLSVLVQRGAAADDLLDGLAGAAGANRVSLCMGRPGPEGGAPRCAGALWRRNWVVARASCLDNRYLYKVRVARDLDGITCEDLYKGKGLWHARKIRVRFVHPEYQSDARVDLALVAVDRGFTYFDRPVNSSSTHRLLNQYAPWMEEVYNKYPMDSRSLSYAHKSSLFSTPLRMFVTAILVPSITFIAFFLFVIFCTGSKDEIPYNNIEYEKYEDSEKSYKCEKTGDCPLV